jgi:purine-binding chemotaxis protein CheW
MNDTRYQDSSAGEPDSSAGSARDRMAETLQQALRGMASGASGSSLSPEMLAELAQRAGVSNPAEVADLARMAGISGAGSEYGGVPQHIVFMLGDIECALPAETVQGVERVSDIAPVPNTVSWVLGIVHLRGSIMSVVNLRGFFGLPAQPVTQRSRMLAVAKRDMTIGMVVDGVTEMRPLGVEEIGIAAPAPMPRWAEPYATRAVHIEGRAIIMLDPERLLFSEKMHRYRADFS